MAGAAPVIGPPRSQANLGPEAGRGRSHFLGEQQGDSLAGGQLEHCTSSITQQPDAAATIYDPALIESNARNGVEAALSAFDAQLNAGVYWEKNAIPQNVAPIFAPYTPMELFQDTANFTTSISKLSMTGGTCTATQTIGYDLENSVRAFPADWTANYSFEIKQPLLQGAWTQFNQIAGPGAVPGVNNGVLFARINTDIALADFEAAVRNLVNDVETSYWELYYAYRNLDAVMVGPTRPWRPGGR